MRQLRLVGLAEDGASLLLESPTGESYRLPVDDRVRAACRGDLTRLGQIEIELDNPLRPREIQMRVRAGESAEQVAASSGMPLDRVLRFAYPVLQERDRVVSQARTTAIRPPASDSLGPLVEERLVSRGTDPATLGWDAWRGEDGGWLVRLSWRFGGDRGQGSEREHSATWTFDLARRALQPADPAAEQLSAEEFHARTITAVTPLAVAARAADEAATRPVRREPLGSRGPGVREPAGRVGEPERPVPAAPEPPRAVDGARGAGFVDGVRVLNTDGARVSDGARGADGVQGADGARGAEGVRLGGGTTGASAPGGAAQSVGASGPSGERVGTGRAEATAAGESVAERPGGLRSAAEVRQDAGPADAAEQAAGDQATDEQANGERAGRQPGGESPRSVRLGDARPGVPAPSRRGAGGWPAPSARTAPAARAAEAPAADRPGPARPTAAEIRAGARRSTGLRPADQVLGGARPAAVARPAPTDRPATVARPAPTVARPAPTDRPAAADRPTPADPGSRRTDTPARATEDPTRRPGDTGRGTGDAGRGTGDTGRGTGDAGRRTNGTDNGRGTGATRASGDTNRTTGDTGRATGADRGASDADRREDAAPVGGPRRIAAAGSAADMLPDMPAETDDERARRATVPSWDDILLGVRRRH